MVTAVVSSGDALANEHSLRRNKPPSWLADWRRPRDVDAVAILRRAAEGRDPKLVKLRNLEMASSAFAFLRGAAPVMAADLAACLSQTSGVQAAVCGDAHLANFGTYFSPERTLVFDVDDFDEARPGPWEWDLARLATSVVVAGRQYLSASKHAVTTVAEQTAAAYAGAIAEAAKLPLVDRCYALTRVADPPGQAGDGSAIRVCKGMRSLFGAMPIQTQSATLKIFIKRGGHGNAFVAKKVTGVDDDVAATVMAAYDAYRATLGVGSARLLDGYSPTCVALHPVGEGSLGLKAYLVKLTGRGPDDGLILQVKEATPSALDRALRPLETGHQGERVVTMQRALQAVSDPLLGWTAIGNQAYYVRQFRDGKGAPALDGMEPAVFAQYAALCGRTLAAAHARSVGDTTAVAEDIAGYIGTGRERREFIAAVAAFARRYAKATRDDMVALKNSKNG
jgi:uncharacterized protein (DUF2252 family)